MDDVMLLQSHVLDCHHVCGTCVEDETMCGGTRACVACVRSSLACVD